MQKRSLYSCLLLFTALLCSACGGSGSSSSSTGGIRLANATTDTSLSLTIGDTTYASGVASGRVSGYTSVDSGSHDHVFVSAADGLIATSATATVSITTDDNYTVVAYARGGQIKLLPITDEKDTPSSGYTSVTVYNAGSDAGAVDVYIVTPGTSISNLSPSFSNVVASGTSLTNSFAAGTYDIIVTAYGKSSDVRLTIPSVTLTSKEILNLVLTPTTGGALLDGALIKQETANATTEQLAPSTKARVRLAASFPGSSTTATVKATIGSNDIGSISTPSAGTYHLVDAGTSSYTVTVTPSGGTATAVASLPSATFASGGDYTILVYGDTPASAEVNVLTDSNLIPTTGAKIRLVNAAVSDAGLTLTDNYVTLFSEIAYGQASDYTTVTAGSSLLVLSAASPTFVQWSNTVSIQSGGVYTVFVPSPDTSTSGKQPFLIKDR